MPVSYNAQQNPYLGINSLATMHGDAQSSDATPFAGPGDPGVGGTWEVTFTNHWAACPTILAGQDGYLQAWKSPPGRCWVGCMPIWTPILTW